MSFRSGSDSESNRSASPINNGPAPTPGHGLDKSPSNSPRYNSNKREHSGSRSRSASATSNRSGSRSRSPSVESNKSVNSRKSRSRTGSTPSNRSSSRASSASHKSGSKDGSPVSNRSRSRSRSSDSYKSKTTNRSYSHSPESIRSRSRSKSATSNRSRSLSKSPISHRSRSRSKSVASQRSRSGGSVASNQSKSGKSDRVSVSRSPSRESNDDQQSPKSDSHPESKKRQQDSPSDNEELKPKKKGKIVSDSENDDENMKEVSAAAIFGDADDISSEEEKETEKNDEETRKSEDEEEQKHASDEEDVARVGDEIEDDKENEPEPIPETRIDVEIPKISCDLGRDIHFVKLPNFLSVETRPFDPETYEDEIDEEETLDEEGRARLKLKVENTIRWRDLMDNDGNMKKQSNARLVKWTDGSYSLHLGSEIFDVYKQPLQGDHNHLFIRQGTGLQGQAVFRTKLSFRPHSTESFTHRKMTLSLADRSQKTSGIKILSQVGQDPDHDRKTLLKKEEEKLKQTVRISKPRKKDSGTRSHTNSSAYREEDGSDEDGAISLNAIKNKYKSAAAAAAKAGAIYSSDEEGSDIEARRARKVDKTKALKDSETSEDSD